MVQSKGVEEKHKHLGKKWSVMQPKSSNVWPMTTKPVDVFANLQQVNLNSF